MNTQESALLAYFEEKIAACAAKREALLADDRADEANFEKIRANVYDIFRTVYTAGKRTADPDAFFLQRLESIPLNWKTALEKAEKYEDAGAVRIEMLKLETAEEIRRVFIGIKEETA